MRLERAERLPVPKDPSLVKDEWSALDHMRFHSYLSSEDYKDAKWWFKRPGLNEHVVYLGKRVCEYFAERGIPLYVCQYLDDGRSFGLAHCVYMDDIPDLCKRMIVHSVRNLARTVNLHVSVDEEVLVVRVDDIEEDADLFVLDQGHFWKQDDRHRWYDCRKASDGSGD